MGTGAASGITYCLRHALAIQRRDLDASRIGAALGAVQADCACPDVCAHRDLGCREVNARYLRDIERRDRLYQRHRIEAASL